MTEKCARCGQEGEDRRTLLMACFYDMHELRVPFGQMELELGGGGKRHFYTLRVCKACRADWMLSIQSWFENKPRPESKGSGVFVRELGATREV